MSEDATIERTASLESIQFAEDGTVFIRFRKRTAMGAEVLQEGWHRTAIPPGTDPAEQLAAVDTHLAEMGFAAPPEASKALLATVAGALHTEPVVAAYRERRARDAALVEGK